jgi:alpha-mannosidase
MNQPRYRFHALMMQRFPRLQQDLATRLWQRREAIDVVGGPVVDLADADRPAARRGLRPVRPGESFGPDWVRPAMHVGEAGPRRIPAEDRSWRVRWFRVEVPAARRGEAGRRFLHWDCRGETTAYLDGEPWAGLDVAHPTCVLPDRACTLWLETGTWQTCMWHPGKTPNGNFQFDGCHLAIRNPLTWQAHWDLDALLALIRHLRRDAGQLPVRADFGKQPEIDRCHPILRGLITALDAACTRYESGDIAGFAADLRGLLAGLKREVWQPSITWLGHSHLDLVWLWPEAVGVRKGIHTWASMLRLREQYPEFRFTQTSPIHLRHVERARPGLHRAIAKQIKAGHWELTGGLWLEADTLIACGEGLARSLAKGQADIAALRGAPSRSVVLPDVFGYPACLPQIMSQAGIDGFFTSKLGWRAVTPFPHTSFVWRSPDGAEVLAHLTVDGDGDNPVSDLVAKAEGHRQSDVHDEQVCIIGVGDGGGGTTEADLERARRFADLAQTPRVAWGTMEGFFDRMAAVRDRLPVFTGELYLEYHRGVFTSQRAFKTAYRQLETALQAQEAAHALAGSGPIAEHAWERLCFAQFHDALPGTSIRRVYDEQTPELLALGEQVRQSAAAALRGRGRSAAVFNPLAVPRTAVIETPDGLRAVGLPACAVVPVADLPSVPASWTVDTRRLDNGLLDARFDAQGQLTSITVGGRTVALAAPAGFTLARDTPANFDAWDIDAHTPATAVPVATRLRLRVVEAGPARAILSATADLGDDGVIGVRWILEAGSSWLRLELDIDWTAERKLLRFHMPTGCRASHARYGAPFGSVLRAQVPGLAHEEAQWEVPASRWATVADGDQGAAIVAEACWGFHSRDGDIGVSLLRAPVAPDPGCDLGRHAIRLAVGIPSSGDAALAAETLFAPVLAVTGSASRKPPFAITDRGSLVPSWIQPLADGAMVLRLHETAGRAGTLHIALEQGWTATPTDLLGRPRGPARRGAVSHDYGAGDLISLRLTR